MILLAKKLTESKKYFLYRNESFNKEQILFSKNKGVS